MPFNGNSNTFDVISEIKTQIGNANTRVNVLGYSTSGDGGGGEFYWDATSTEADNGGTILQVTGVTTGRWKRVLDGNSLNILWFGAKNDYTSTSTTDNLTAINRAIAAAVVIRDAGNDGQVIPNIVSIYFPFGKGFRVTNTVVVPSNVGVIMDGQLVYDNSSNSSPALIIGDGTRTQRKVYVIDVINKNSTIWPAEDGNGNFTTNSIGVKFLNHQYCDIFIRRAVGFSIGAQCFGDPFGFVYNEVKLGQFSGNKVQLDLSNANSGWCNENNFFGGRFSTSSNVNNNGKNRYGIRITSADGTYINNNNNNFYKPCFELDGSIANPGIALPILIVHGAMNAFYNCRSENNYVASTALIRTLNDSAQNTVEVGFGIDGTVEDLGNYPSTVSYRRGKTLTEKNYINCFDSGDLLKKVCPYDTTNTYAADELSFLNSSDSNIYNLLTSITVNSDSVQLSSSRGIGVRIDTTLNKKFVVKKSTINGSAGRICVRCFNAAGTVLYSTTTPYVKGYPFSVPNANSSFGGHYRTGTDSSSPFYFVVEDDVAFIDVFVSGGTNPVKLRQLQIQAIDSHAAVISPKKKNGLYAIQIPTTGTWAAGDVIHNATPGSNNIVMWQCTVSGTPGTWVAVYNANKTVTSVNGSTGDVVVAPASGSGNYIQNQFSSAQTANAWITGILRSNSNFESYLGNAGAHFKLKTSAGLDRIAVGLSGTESGSNTGSDLTLWRYDDTGGFIGPFFTGQRSTGNIGIGVSNPIFKMHVLGDINAQALPGADAILQTDVSGVSVSSFRTIRSNGRTAIYNNGTEAITIPIGGNVGIGTTSPQFKLQVSHTSSTAFMGVGTTALGSLSGAFLSGFATGSPTADDQRLGGVAMGSNTSGTTYVTGAQMESWSESAWTVGTSHPTYMRFLTTAAGSNILTERMRIAANGNVGIGITGPTEKLTVGGNVLINSANDLGLVFNGPSSIVRHNAVDLKITTNRLGINTTGTAAATLDVNGAIFTRTTSAEGLRVINDGGIVSFYNTANATRTGFLNMNTVGGCILSVELNQPLSLRTNNQERLHIAADGDVGIGTNNPGAKLEVNGQVKITGGSPGTNKVLTSDSTGLATWTTLTAITSYNVVIPPITANYTVQTTDYYIILKPTTAASRQLVLPNPSLSSGRALVIMYDAGASPGTSFQWSFSHNIFDAIGGFRSGFNPSIGGVLRIFSDGTNWRLEGEQ